MAALLIAFAVVFLAEFGDKTELLTLGLAATYGAWPVLIGVAVTTAVINVVSVTAGAALAHVVPPHAVSAAAGVAFLAFAVWSGRSATHPLDVRADLSRRQIVLRSAGMFALSEVGDKTMLATIALAAHLNAVAVWTGSTAGIVAAEALAVLVGAQLGNRVSQRAVRAGSAVVFAALGVALLVKAAV